MLLICPQPPFLIQDLISVHKFDQVLYEANFKFNWVKILLHLFNFFDHQWFRFNFKWFLSSVIAILIFPLLNFAKVNCLLEVIKLRFYFTYFLLFNLLNIEYFQFLFSNLKFLRLCLESISLIDLKSFKILISLMSKFSWFISGHLLNPF